MTETAVDVDWRSIGCKPMRRVSGTSRAPAGRAAWRLRAPRRARDDWTIEASHCPYLDVHPYEYGPDAWRISIQKPVDDHMSEVAHVVARSEAEAFASVAWLDAVARSHG